MNPDVFPVATPEPYRSSRQLLNRLDREMKDEEEGRARNHVQHQAALNRNKSLERQLRATERALERAEGKNPH